MAFYVLISICVGKPVVMLAYGVVSKDPSWAFSIVRCRDVLVLSINWLSILKGFVQCLHPIIVPQWLLLLVLARLMKPPFKPLEFCSSALLSRKVVFLVLFISPNRVNELLPLRVDPPFLKVFSHRVVLYLSFNFLFKILSIFYLAQKLFYWIFFPQEA